MNINEVLTYFKGIKQISGAEHYVALCPCHNDHEPSLDIKAGTKGIVMSCPVCGANGKDVMQRLGLKVRDLFYESSARNAQNAAVSTNQSKSKSVDYFYSDKLKKTRYYVWSDKKQAWKKVFGWWYKDGTSGEWLKGLPKDKDGNSIMPPLYKQDSIANAVKENKTIYIVEGEKDCNTMCDKLHLLAVCSPHGASNGKSLASKWSAKYNKLFTGANVAIIPDNDSAGHNISEYIAEQILPYAASVKVLDLSKEWLELPEKSDITDIYEGYFKGVYKPYGSDTAEESVRFRLEALRDVTAIYQHKNPPIPSLPNERDSHRDTARPSTPTSEASEKPEWVYSDYNGIVRIDEAVYTDYFVKKYGVKCIKNVLYTVNGAMNDEKAKHIIITDIKPYAKKDNARRTNELLKSIKYSCFSEPQVPDPGKIHVGNGTLSKDENGLFTVFSPEKEFCVNRIAANYNSNAKPPEKFLRYLNTVFHADDIKTIQQYCGYCLIPTTALQKALFIIGNGGEGKSVLGTILAAVIGENNCNCDSVHRLEERFGIANVENKLLWIDDDIDEAAFKTTNNFKSLVTNKRKMQAEKKNVQSNEITPYIRFIVFGNFTPQALYDTSDGWTRRQIVIQAKPKDKDRIDDLLCDDKILHDELEGILLWLLEGLNALIKSGLRLYISERTQAESDRLLHENDTVQCFLDKCVALEIGDGKCEFSNVLYVEYCDYCDDNLLVPLKKNGFVSALKIKGEKLGIKRDNNVVINGIRRRGFSGIGIDSASRKSWVI